MPYKWDSTSNELSLNKTSKSEEIFHLFSTQYSVLTTNCTLQWPWITINFFIINATPMRQHLKRTVFNKKRLNLKRFFSYLVRNTQYSQNIVLYNELEELLTSLLLMPHLWDSVLNEPSWNKTSKFKEIFHLTSM